MIRSSEHSATKIQASTLTRTTLEASITKQSSKDHDSDNDTNNKRDNNDEEEDTTSSDQHQIANHNDQQQDQSSEQGDNSSSSFINHDNITNRTPKRNPFCSRCRNHGKSIQVKGHKRHCEYRECKCEGCFDVECRQIISARQIKRRRDQKQDEECGRQIEISPPVLRREPNNDPAALIAKTLIGSSSGKHLHHQHQQQHQVILDTNAQKFSTQASIHHPYHHQLLPHLSIHPAAAASNLASSTAQISTHNQLHGAGGSSGNNNNNNNNNNSSSSNDTNSNSNNNTNNKSLHLHGAHLNLANAQSPQRTPQGGVTSSTASTALSNALHLFQLPNSMFSPAAASIGGPSSGHPSSTVNLPLPPAITSSPLPSFCEQITLVEEIHNTFGPLAIYAWLKAENFDIHRVRDSIESSLSSYNNLIDLKFKYRLSSDSSSSCNVSSRGGININNNNSTSNNVNNSNHLHHLQPQRQASTSMMDTVVTEDVNNVNCNHSGISRNGFISDNSKHNNKSSLIATQTLATTPTTALNVLLSCSTPSLSTATTTTTTPTTMSSASTLTPTPIAKIISNYQNISSTTPALAPPPPPPATTTTTTTSLTNHLPTYPMCRISSSFSNGNNYINSDNNNFSKSPALAHHHHHAMSLASSLNSLPMPTPNGLLWPDLKLATNGIPSASMIPPHHLLPHFMHHPFLVHQIHNQNQQVSPSSSIANLSSSSESSSSTIL